MKTFLQCLRLLLGLTLLTGGLYPLAVWAVGHVLFQPAAEGSLLGHQGKIVGSVLLAQKTIDPKYFSPRPSAGDFATVASGASNLAWTNGKLRAAIATNAETFRAQNGLPSNLTLPADVTTTSSSGLDPDLSPAALRLQVARIAKSRGLAPEKIFTLVEKSIETSLFGPARVNVLKLNLALDEMR